MSNNVIKQQIALYKTLIERAKKLQADYSALVADMEAVGLTFNRWEWEPPWEQIEILEFRIESDEELLA